PGHSQFLEFRYARRPWASQDIDWTLQVFHQASDDRRVAQAGDEDAVGSGIAKRGKATQSFVVALLGCPDREQIAVGAGIQDDWQFPRGLHPFDLQRQVK